MNTIEPTARFAASDSTESNAIDVAQADARPIPGKVRLGRPWPATLALTIALAAATSVALRATPVGVPNGSFELPGTSYATNSVDDWQKSPQPVWFDPATFGGTWDQLTGVFLNTPATNSSHIDNCDGNQAAFFFALPEVALFQDYNSTYGTNTTPTHAFDAKFEAGKSYTLTVGVIGGGGGMINGATMQLSLYYRDATSNMVIVATTTITNDPAIFPTNTHFVDFQVQVPVVKAGDAWAGRNIGIQLLSTIDFTQQLGGYWDLDNVRLTETIDVPNGSFELPGTSYATNSVDDWQKSPQPVWFDPATFGGTWDQLTGVFLNTPATNSSHIDNCDGNQAAFFFALPEVALFQDYNSTYGTNTTPTHAFDAKFEAGKSYTLTVGVIGGGGGMINGATMQLSLYYRDATSNMVIVATTTITNDPAIFPTNTHFVDFQVQVPVVKAGDAWAGRNIGIQLLSTIDFTQQLGGYWDLDNVRLTAVTAPVVNLHAALAGSDLQITWLSIIGYQYQVKISEDFQSWSDYEAPLSGTGGELFKLIPTTGRTNAYFDIVATPGQ